MWKALDLDSPAPSGFGKEVHKYPFRTTYRTSACMPPVDEKHFSIDNETEPREFNFPFMFVKARDCE
jgi:hypothetical protein